MKKIFITLTLVCLTISNSLALKVNDNSEYNIRPNFKSLRNKKVDVIKNLESIMDYSTEKQKIIAANIAQANVPHARAKTLKKYDYKKQFKKMKAESFHLNTTSSNHIPGSQRSSRFQAINDPEANEFTPTGNNIVLADQVKNASDNSINYQTYTKLLAKNYALLKTAISGR
ncbi:MAG: hypothetical protein J0H68_03785 [Sphingobacteriia bacterium]|nr:hypothetical protein [Sphingobacteriia bacterium]